MISVAILFLHLLGGKVSKSTGTLHYLIKRILITDVRIKLLGSVTLQEELLIKHFIFTCKTGLRGEEMAW